MYNTCRESNIQTWHGHLALCACAIFIMNFIKRVGKEIFRVSSSAGLEQPSRRYQRDKIGSYFQKIPEIVSSKPLDPIEQLLYNV